MLNDEIFIIFEKNANGVIEKHTVRHGGIDKDTIATIFSDAEEVDSKSDESQNEPRADPEKIDTQSPFPETFQEVERSLFQAMLMYRKSVVETINFAPVFASAMLGISIERVANSHGTKRNDLSVEEIHVYSLPAHAFSSILGHIDQSEALIQGAQHLPKIATIGIISSYDAILSDLLRVIFKLTPEVIFTSDRVVKFSDIIDLKSLDAVRDNIISEEIESVIRQSHHEQFTWMEKKFGMKMREGLDVWPSFIELCERRNLLTHTGGVVSDQYLKNCEKFGRKAKYQVGDKLDVDLKYLMSAINIISEIGYKLIHTMWRKFLPDERAKADSFLNTTGMDLIDVGEFELAENLLNFGVNQKQHSSDLLKRMMIVNLANAAKLGGNKERCEKALSSHDWSATSYQFQTCVAAVRNDFDELNRLLQLGTDVIEITLSNFRDWPVFRDARKDTSFKATFNDVFGEPLTKDSSAIDTSFKDDKKVAETEGKVLIN